eukprot:SAG11_NODE_1132_length_5752_cov_8.739685_6_plen_49_part_00
MPWEVLVGLASRVRASDLARDLACQATSAIREEEEEEEEEEELPAPVS